MSNDVNILASYLIMIQNQIKESSEVIGKELRNISYELQRLNRK